MHTPAALGFCSVLLLLLLLGGLLGGGSLGSLLLLGGRADDVRIAGVGDAHGADAEVLAAGSAEVDVVASVVVHRGLGEHGVVLDLRLAEGGGVARQDDELGLC